MSVCINKDYIASLATTTQFKISLSLRCDARDCVIHSFERALAAPMQQLISVQRRNDYRKKNWFIMDYRLFLHPVEIDRKDLEEREREKKNINKAHMDDVGCCSSDPIISTTRA